VTPKSGVFLLGACVSAIAAVGSVFELASGTPDLGNATTSGILVACIPLTALCFWAAVQDTRAKMK
jgi:hypothetical protein